MQAGECKGYGCKVAGTVSGEVQCCERAFYTGTDSGEAGRRQVGQAGKRLNADEKQC